MQYERRSHKRLSVPGTTPVTVELDLRGHPVRGLVLELSRRGMRTSFADGSGLEDADGRFMGNVLLGLPDGRACRLRVLEVRQVLSTNGDGCVVRFVAEDEQARAALWLAMERLEGADPAPCTASAPPLAKIPARGVYTEEARLERLDFLRRETGAELASLSTTSLRAERLTGNIENLMGGVEIPVGIAGPLLFRGEYAQGHLYAPMATTEGALVGSASRGARALSLSGGVAARVIRQQMMRVPVFWFANMRGAVLFAGWIRDHFDEIRDEAHKVSQHARLVSVEPYLMGNMVNVFFSYSTGDAAGQNMTTSCTWHACQWLMKQVGYLDDIELENFLIDGNMSGDKKVNFHSFISGRGIRVMAECFLEREVLARILKTTPEQLADTHERTMAGGIQVGMIGYNVNVANLLAAVYTATGQDIACVHESGLGQLYLRRFDDGIYASLLLPSLIVGTVGGGTHLSRQHDLLEMMGCTGPGGVFRLAEMIAGFSLGLDISTLSAVASGQFASAHERLGRNRPIRWFAKEDLNPQLFQPGLRRALGDERLVVESVTPIETKIGSSIITELTATKVRKLIGLFPIRLTCRLSAGETRDVDVFVKVKPIDEEIILMTNSVAAMCGGRLATSYGRYKHQTGFVGCHLRELGIYGQTDPRFVRHVPRVYDTVREDSRETYIVVLERLHDLELMDSADDVSGWGPRHIEAAIEGLAELHSIWYGREEELRSAPWYSGEMTSTAMVSMSELWHDLAAHAAQEFPEWVLMSDVDYRRGIIESLAEWWPEIEAQPRTLIHNDFNPRNLAFRRTPGGLRVCAYDWELATVHVPQRDLIELLSFVLTADSEAAELEHFSDLHRRALQSASGMPIDRDSWRRGLLLGLRDFAVNRLALYLMAHTFRHYGFMRRVFETHRRLCQIVGDM